MVKNVTTPPLSPSPKQVSAPFRRVKMETCSFPFVMVVRVIKKIRNLVIIRQGKKNSGLNPETFFEVPWSQTGLYTTESSLLGQFDRIHDKVFVSRNIICQVVVKFVRKEQV
jgi:hypothetical protein